MEPITRYKEKYKNELTNINQRRVSVVHVENMWLRRKNCTETIQRNTYLKALLVISESSL